MFAGGVVGGVILAIRSEAGGELLLERGDVLGLRVPVHVEGLDLGAQEVVGAAGAEFGEAGGVLGIDEAEDLLVVLHGADEALLLGDLSAEPREDGGEGGVAGRRIQSLILGAAEGLGVSALVGVFFLDVGGGFFDEVERAGVADLFVVVPRDEAVLAHHDGFHVGLLAGDFLHGEAELEAGAHPGHVGHVAAEDFLGELFAVLGSGDGDDRVGVHVIDVLAGEEGVQRGIDRGGARIEVERGVEIHVHHRVFGLGLDAFVGLGGIDLLEGDELVLVEGREVVALAGAEVAAGAFDPEDFDFLASERVEFEELGGGVAAAGVGDALVAAEEVGAINEAGNGIEGGGFGVVPGEVNVGVGGHGDV